MTKIRQTKTATEGYRIENGELWYGEEYFCDVGTEAFARSLESTYTTSIRVISLATNWVTNEYLAGGKVLETGVDMQFTIRRELRGTIYHWYAYRRAAGVLNKKYVGHSEQVTTRQLGEIASKLGTTRKTDRSMRDALI